MTLTSSLPATQASDVRRTAAADVALFALLSLGYWVAAIQVAAAQPYWMDEVLALWTARMPTAQAIWNALKAGAEFSPPVFHLVLQKIIQLGGDDALWLRMPSMAATYVAALCAFVLTRRRYPTPLALLAMALCLASSLFWFGVQMRQYAPVAGCFALALVLWDIPADRRPGLLRASALALLLACAVGMHFYAVLLAAAIGLMELVWTAIHRRIRWPFFIAIGIGCLSVFLWLPIMQSVAGFNAGDTAAPEYYARPIVGELPAIYGVLMVGLPNVALSPLSVLLATLIVTGILRITRGSAKRPHGTFDNLDVIIWACCATPLLVFLFACLVTHAFNTRYVVAASIGLVLLTVSLIARMPWAAATSYATVVVAIGVWAHTIAGGPMTMNIHRALALAERAPPGLPIATGDGLRFFELREGASADKAPRLVYLKSPTGTASPDPTNEHQVERWGALDPSLAVLELAPFLATNPRFLLISVPGAVDLLPKQLADRGYTITIIARDGDAYLADVTAPR